MDELNKDMLRSWTPEERDEYQKCLQQRMGQAARFYEILVEVRVEQGDYQHGDE